MSTIIVSVKLVNKAGHGHVIFICYGAGTKDQAVDMVQKYVEDVRAGRRTPAAQGDYWGLPTDTVPQFVERKDISDNEVSMKWSIDGSLEPGGLRSGTNIRVELY